MLRKITKFAISILFLFLLSSCGLFNNKPKEIKAELTRQFILHVDEQFSKVDHDIVVDSFVRWQHDTHGVIRFVVSPTKWNSTTDDLDYSVNDDDGCTLDVYVASITSKNKSIVELEKGNVSGNTLGFTQRQCEKKIVAFVMDRINNQKSKLQMLKSVGIHEAGHLIGLAHIPVPNESIMFPSIDHSATCPTRLDMSQLCLKYGCNYHDMIYCESH
jgi:hypothetical protein